MNKYAILIALVGTFFIVELVVGIVGNSIALQTDAFHMLSDLMALIIAQISFTMSQRGHKKGFSYGWIRAEIIGGLTNSVFLMAMSFSLSIEIIDKIIELSENDWQNPKLDENINLVMITAGIGLLINLIGLFMFHGDHQDFHGHHHDNNINHIHDNDPQENSKWDEELGQATVNYNNYAVFLHILGDTLGSIVVIGTSLMVKYLDWKWKYLFDPIASALIVVFIMISSWKLFKACGLILLHRTPHRLNYDLLLLQIKGINGIESLHDVHIWPLNTNVILATIHVKIRQQTLRKTDQIITEIKNILHTHGIHASVIQPEFSESCLEPNCPQDECEEKKCCQPNSPKN